MIYAFAKFESATPNGLREYTITMYKKRDGRRTDFGTLFILQKGGYKNSNTHSYLGPAA